MAGAPAGKAPESIAGEGIAQLASNESPWGPHPAVIEAIGRAAAASNRYPDPSGSLLRRRIAERYEVDPSEVAVANGSCEILLAAALALCEPGAEIVFAWPSFSMYPYLAPLSGAREIRRRRSTRRADAHDLDAMLAEITAATQLVIVCNPNNPTVDPPAGGADRRVPRAGPGPRHRDRRRGLHRVPGRRRPGRDGRPARRFPNLVLLRTFSKVYGLAGLRVGYALGSPKFRAAVDAVRQPFIDQRDRPGGCRRGDSSTGDDVASRVERTIVERVMVEEGVRELGLETPDSQTNFSWIALGDADEGEVVAELGEQGILVRPGAALGGPGHIRVSYGTPNENQRFLAALGELV